MNRSRTRVGFGRDEHGAMVILFALLLTTIMIIGALVVDLGSARQQRAHDASAADAGALAGAKGLDATTQIPSGCPDANCTAAFYALASLDILPSNVSSFASARSTCTLELRPL